MFRQLLLQMVDGQLCCGLDQEDCAIVDLHLDGGGHGFGCASDPYIL